MLYVALTESKLQTAESSVMIWRSIEVSVLMAVLLAGTKPTGMAGCCSCLESSSHALRVVSQRSFSILTAEIGSSNIYLKAPSQYNKSKAERTSKQSTGPLGKLYLLIITTRSFLLYFPCCPVLSLWSSMDM